MAGMINTDDHAEPTKVVAVRRSGDSTRVLKVCDLLVVKFKTKQLSGVLHTSEPF